MTPQSDAPMEANEKRQTIGSSDEPAEISLGDLFNRFRWRIIGTWLLVVLEAASMLLFPLIMGIAIDDLLQQSYQGVHLLGLVGMIALVVGAARRFYDTRLYSGIYVSVTERIVAQERVRGAAVSVISARTGMVSELVEFLENSFPAIIDCIIGLVGTLVMIWLLQAKVFASCLGAAGIVFAIYLATRRRTYLLNKGVNDESEKGVDVLTQEEMPQVSAHFRRLMQWNIRLSDLETINFSLSWLVMIAVLLFSVVATVQSGVTSHGKVLSILMYVFGYIESVVAIPLFYQQSVRLQEISHRLVGDHVPDPQPLTT